MASLADEVIFHFEFGESGGEKKREAKRNKITGKEWITVDERMQEDIKVCWESVRILLPLGNIRAARWINRQELETEWLFSCKRII